MQQSGSDPVRGDSRAAQPRTRAALPSSAVTRNGYGGEVREAISLIEADGWDLVATRASDRQYRHPTKPGRVTIAGKPSDDLAPGTLNSI